MSRLFNLRKLCSLSVAVLALAGATSAQAALLMYDPYDIGPGAYLKGNDNLGVNVLGGQNPVEGPTDFYAGGWVQSGGDAQAVRQTSLAYPFFPRSGGHVTDSVQFSCCSFGRNGREIGELDPINAPGELGIGFGRGSRTIYQSFLVDFGGQGTDNPADFGKRGVELWNGGIGDSNLAVDLFFNHFSGVTELSLNVPSSGLGNIPLNGGGLTLAGISGVHLFVMKYEVNPLDDLGDPLDPTGLLNPLDDDRVTVYMDPTDSIEANWTPAASVTVASSSLLISHQGGLANFTFSGGGHVPGRFDEVRWGDTFADVTPFVPEPTSLTLLGISLGGLLMGRRR